jgi:hypothetical protein
VAVVDVAVTWIEQNAGGPSQGATRNRAGRMQWHAMAPEASREASHFVLAVLSHPGCSIIVSRSPGRNYSVTFLDGFVLDCVQISCELYPASGEFRINTL